jgi:NADH dehydrogenase
VPCVVLLGCGYTSVWAYRSLRPLVRRGEVNVTVVSPDPAHVFHGFTGELVSGELPPRAQATDVALACPGARRHLERPLAPAAMVLPTARGVAVAGHR